MTEWQLHGNTPRVNPESGLSERAQQHLDTSVAMKALGEHVPGACEDGCLRGLSIRQTIAAYAVQDKISKDLAIEVTEVVFENCGGPIPDGRGHDAEPLCPTDFRFEWPACLERAKKTHSFNQHTDASESASEK